MASSLPPPGFFRCNRCPDLHPLTGASLAQMSARAEYVYIFAAAQNAPSTCGAVCRKLACPACVRVYGYQCGTFSSPHLTFAKEDLQGAEQRTLLGTSRLESRLMAAARELYVMHGEPTARPYASEAWYVQTLACLKSSKCM